jgi:hypothetical protein
LRVLAVAASVTAIVLAVVACQVFGSGSGGSGLGPGIPVGAFFVSATKGSDSNPGTESRPWRTLDKAIATARSGDTVVLEPGTYGANGATTSFERSGRAAAPITFTSRPDSRRATIRGYVRVIGSNIHLDSLVFAGPTGPVASRSPGNPGGQEVQLSIMYGSGAVLRNSEVKDNDWHAGVFVSKATNVLLEDDYIHDNGDPAGGINTDHGVYWYSGGGKIVGCRIEGNAAYGVQLYPAADGVVVARNTIAHNGHGGVVVGNDATDNVIRENLIVDNGEYGIRAFDLDGSGNAAPMNLIWGNGLPSYGEGIAITDSVETNPATLSPAQLSTYGVGLGG